MGLIERILEKVLSDHAGEFLKVNREQLAASLMKGEVVLTGVELRVEPFKEMMKMLPFTIKSAKVNTLKAKVPWNELRSKSVRIQAGGVEIVLVPQNVDEHAAGDTWAEVVKRQRLHAAEMLMNGLFEGEAEREAKKEQEAASLPEKEEENEDLDDLDSEDIPSSTSNPSTKKKSRMTLLQRVVARIVDNLSVTVENLEVRYEDNSGFSLGLKVEEFSLFTIGPESNEQQFIDRTIRPTPANLRRRIKVKGLGIYWEDALKKRRRDLLRPFGVGVTLTQHLVANPQFKFSIDARTEGRVILDLGPSEYGDLAKVVERATAHEEFVNRSAILKHRPIVSAREDPIGWWRFAIRGVLAAIRQDRIEEGAVDVFPTSEVPVAGDRQQTQRNRWSKVFLLIQQRWKYVLLYKRRLIAADSKFQARAKRHAVHSRNSSEAEDTNLNLHRLGSMAMKGEVESRAEEQAADSILRELEIELPFQLIMLFRAFAEAEFREEKIRLKRLHRSRKMPVRALNAVVQGASTGRKMVLKSLGLIKSSVPLVPTGNANTTASSLAGRASSLGQQADANEDSSWTLDAKEKQELYESVALDPATAWMIEKTSASTSGAVNKMGIEPSFEAAIVVPTLSVQFFSSDVDCLVEIRLQEMRTKVQNWGAAQTSKRSVMIPLWEADFSLGSADLVDLRPEVINGANIRVLNHRYIPGGLRTTRQQQALVRLHMAATYLGKGERTKVKVAGEVRQTQLIISLSLIEGLVRVVTRVQSLDSVAPTTLSKVRALRERAKTGVKSTLKQTLDVRIDWDTPSICIPISIEESGIAGRGLELDLGQVRFRTAADDSQLEVEAHGMKSAVRVLERSPGPENIWVLAPLHSSEKNLDPALLEKMSIDVKIHLERLTLNIETTPVIIKLDDQHFGALGRALSDALEVVERLGNLGPSTPRTVKQHRSAPPYLMPLDVSVRIPKVDVHMTVPCRMAELRVKRMGWGDALRSQEIGPDGLLPLLGWIKLRLTAIVLTGKRGSDALRVDLDTIHARDDLQRAGEHFRDFVKVDGPIRIEVDNHHGARIHIGSDVLVNWNPSSMDALLYFVSTSISTKPVTPKIAKNAAHAIPGKIKLRVDMPKTFRLMLNQETIGTRLGVIRLEAIQFGVLGDKISAKIHNMSFYGLQWEPLTAVSGMQLFGSELNEEFQRKDNLVEAEVDLGTKTVDFVINRGRFLWAHTFTKQFADYFADGVSAVLARHLKPTSLSDNVELLSENAPSPDLQMLIRGRAIMTSLVCPAQRFGKEFRYDPSKTDEFYAMIHEAGIGVSLFNAAAKRNCVVGMYRSQDAGGCRSDATMSFSAIGADDVLAQQDPVVEIRLDCSRLDLESVKKQQGPHRNQSVRATICRKIRGLLAWHIVDFTRDQKLARASCKPLTAREQAKLNFDRAHCGEFGIPYGEHPHGVSPQKFEMCVEVAKEDARFELSPTDVHLMFLIIFENILDHRRRSARAPPPRLPLFETEPFADWGDDLLLGPDELVGGNFGDVCVRQDRFELAAKDMNAEQLQFDADGFGGGNVPPIVDLDLTLRIPQFLIVLVTPESRLPFAELNCTMFEMALSEFYDRSQFIEISLDRLLVTSASSDPSLAPIPLLDVRSSSFLKNPTVLRTRNADVTFGNTLTHWHYERTTKPLYIMVTKFPQKDRRVEIGLERMDLNIDMTYIERLSQIIARPEMINSIKDTDDRKRLKLPGYANGPHRARRALVVEAMCNRYGIKLSSSAENLLLKGSLHFILAINRTGITRSQVQLVAGTSLRAISDDDASLLDEEELNQENADGKTPVVVDFDACFRSWLEGVYTEKNPVKLCEVDSIVRAFAGNESELIHSVSTKYDVEPFDLLKFRRLQEDGKWASMNIAEGDDHDFRKVSSTHRRTASGTGATTTPSQGERYREVTIAEPFGVRVDVNVDSLAIKQDLVVLVEPIQIKLTNGQLEACSSILSAYDLRRLKAQESGTTSELAPHISPHRHSSVFGSMVSSEATEPSISIDRSASVSPMPSIAMTTTVTLLVHGFEMNLVNDYGNSHSFPLVRASVSGVAAKFNSSKFNAMTMTLNVAAATRTNSPQEAGLPVARVDYFNPRLLAWEPLLEPWDFEFVLKNWNKVEFKSRRPLNFNVSYSFVESFAYWLACRSARKSGGRLLAGSSHSEYYIVNETGLPMVFSIPGETISKQLASGQRAPLKFVSSRLKGGSAISASTPPLSKTFYRDPRQGLRVGEDETVTLSRPVTAFSSPSLRLSEFSKSRQGGVALKFLARNSNDEFARVARIGIDTFGTFVYGLDRPATKVTIHVSLEHGSKIIRVLSPVQVRNLTVRPMTLLMYSSKEQKHWALGPVPTDGVTFPIPLDRLDCECRLRPVTPNVSGGLSQSAADAMSSLSRTELEAEAADAISRASDENGYGWSSPGINMPDLHKLVDRPVAIMCDRSKSFSRSAEGKATFYEQDASHTKGGGRGYRFSCLLGVESFESSDDMGLRETYVMTFSPLMRIQNRLPCPLLLRTIKREIVVQAGAPADLPVSGGRIRVGDDVDVIHVAPGWADRRHRRHSSVDETSQALQPARGATAVIGEEKTSSKVKGSGDKTPAKPKGVGDDADSSKNEEPLMPANQVLRDVWVNLSVPGFNWSIPFQPSTQATNQSVVVSHMTVNNTFVRLMLECDRISTGMLRVAVFVESWFLNDAKALIGLQYRQGGVGGEQLIYEMGSKFKDRGEQAANLIYELGQNLKLRALMRGNNMPPSPSSTTLGEPNDLRDATLSADVKLAQVTPAKPLKRRSSSLLSAEDDTPNDGVPDRRSSTNLSSSDEFDFGLFSEGRSVSVRFAQGGMNINSSWSKALSLDSVGAQMDVICDMEADDPLSGKRKFVQGLLGVSVKTAPSVFRRSCIVTFAPRMVFVNGMQKSLLNGAHSDGAGQSTNEDVGDDNVVLCFSSSPSPSFSDPLLTCVVETVNAMVVFDQASLRTKQLFGSSSQGSSGAGSSNGLDDVEGIEANDAANGMGNPAEAKRISPVLRLAIRKRNEWWGWSGPFSCSESGGEFALKLKNQMTGGVLVVRVKSEERDATTIVSVEEESFQYPLYRIINQTDEAIHYFQPLVSVTGGRGIVERLITRGSHRVFGWDEPNNLHRAVRLGFRGDLIFQDMKIDELSGPQMLHLPSSRQKPGRSVWLSVRIRGITKTLTITDRPPQQGLTSGFRRGLAASSEGLSVRGASSDNSRVRGIRSNETEVNEDPTKRQDEEHVLDEDRSMMNMRVELAQIGVSLVDRAPQELVFISLTDVLVDYSRKSPSANVLAFSTTSRPNASLSGSEDDVDGIEDSHGGKDSSGTDALDITVRRIQVDDQLSEAQFPVVLGPSTSWFIHDETARPLMFRFSFVRRLPPPSIRRFDFYRFALLQLYELDVKVEDTLLLLLGRMAWECAMSLRSEEELVSGKVNSESEGAYARLKRWTTITQSSAVRIAGRSHEADKLRSISSWMAKRPTRSLEALAATVNQPESSSGTSSGDPARKKVYFALLHISPLYVNLSFRFTAHDPKSLLALGRFKTAAALRGDQVGIGAPAQFDADYVARSLPPALINVDNAKIRLLELFVPHILADKQTLAKTVARHYSRQAITQVYRILGSSDLMGNPLGVVRDLGTGLNDFVSQPIIGLAKASPTEFVKGLGRGSFSLLRHVTLGTFDAVSKVTGALGAGIALLSLDHRFVAARWSQLRFEQPRTAASGLTMGLRALANALYDGAGGIVVRPLRSVAEEGSAQAFARELGLGIVGIVVKPVVGILDLASRASNGVTASVQRFDPEAQSWSQRASQRVRLPRAFKGLERRLDPYLEEDAFVSHMIKLMEPTLPAPISSASLALGKEQDHFDYQAHASLDGSLFMVAAGSRLWLLDGNPVIKHNAAPNIIWDMPLNVVNNITFSKEPEFPAVRIWISAPGAFHRTATRLPSGRGGPMQGGAADAELVVLGTPVGGDSPATSSRAIVVFHVDSHAKARAVVKLMKGVLPTFAGAMPPSLASPKSSSPSDSGDIPQPRRLGLAVGPLPSQMKKLTGPVHVGGAGVVLKIIPDTPASKAGLKEGDIVLTCDGQPLDRDNPHLTLKAAACRVPPNEIVLTVKRASMNEIQRFTLGVD